MATIESYNASYPLSYYQIGNVYSFYGTKNAKMAEPATDEQIRKYSNKLIELEQERTNSAISLLAMQRHLQQSQADSPAIMLLLFKNILMPNLLVYT